MNDFKVGALYRIKLKTGVYRILVLGYRTYFDEKPLYYYDLDNSRFGECEKKDILNYQSLDINMIKNTELKNKLLNLQSRFPSIVKREEEESEELSKITQRYKAIKEEYDNAHKRYRETIHPFYTIEAEGNRLGLDLINMGFTLNSQKGRGNILSIKEFENKIWEYLNPEIKNKLLNLPRFYLNFEAVTNNDDGCFYEFEIYRNRLLEYPYEIKHETKRYYNYLNKEISKEDKDLMCLNTVLFAPYERGYFFHGYRSCIHKSYRYRQNGVSKRLNKQRNIYECRLITREFDPFPLTEENARIIAEGIFIDSRLI